MQVGHPLSTGDPEPLPTSLATARRRPQPWRATRTDQPKAASVQHLPLRLPRPASGVSGRAARGMALVLELPAPPQPLHSVCARHALRALKRPLSTAYPAPRFSPALPHTPGSDSPPDTAENLCRYAPRLLPK